jgi:tRNA modification GTPase
LHLHGGPAVVAGVLDALVALGLRPAEPGAFTRRAFEAGRLDLTEAEGLADLVAAETAGQRRQALRQMGGALGALYEGWRAALISALAHVEAEIDFVDEADVPEGLAEAARARLGALVAAIEEHLADASRGERLREGLEVAILGAPNAGKSSLLNALVRREAAIVSAIAGTTRDVIEAQLDLGGWPVTLADTAGLRASADEIEGEGVRRALQRAERADLKLLVAEAGRPLPPEVAALLNGDALLVRNKADLAAAEPDGLAVSALTGAGLPELRAALEREAARRLDSGPAPALTRARHRAALEDCAAALRRALLVHEHELIAEDLRLAARALGRVTGRVDVEDILDAVFAEFCIGK